MTAKVYKIVRLTIETYNRLEITRTHRRETIDDLINNALDLISAPPESNPSKDEGAE